MIKNLLCAFLSLFMVALGLEVGLRVLRPDAIKVPEQAEKQAWISVPEKIWTRYHKWLGWDHIPDKKSRLIATPLDVEVNTNTQGFRGTRDYEIESDSAKRVMVLGDSFPFGFGVEDPDVFTAQMEKENPDLEVLNLAVSGYGMDQVLLSYRLKGRMFKPDVVLIGIYPEMFWRVTRAFTDAGYAKPYFFLSGDEGLILKNSPVPERYSLTKNQFPQIYEPSGFENVLLKSRLYGFVKRNVVRFGKNTGFIDPDLTPEWFVGKEILKQLVMEIRKDGAVPVILTCPPLRWIQNDEKSSLEKSILRFAKWNRVNVVSMTDVLKTAAKQATPEVFYIPGDGHWSEKGHELVAQAVAGQLGSRNLL